MSAVIENFVETLHPKAKGQIKGTAKLQIGIHGTIMLSETGAYEGDELADVTLMASEDTFRAILDGSQNPVMAFMSGKLKVDGNTTRALKVSSILTA
ncbi:SCP2 sterol-binding domain-containing protein [Litoreibacter roseus]|uniref:Sterol-binding domain-containing protein n=1 Tax=Litoreibacter roseus TaxID=2601869 RepID=A0A6N6JBN2_9RHOB|nr:SCP2 sterol-binding domain-containing protein [Litoreibacter roseus]GFE63585.1 sterol-binding domain-containing protein [Litoreibacter roseus]